MSVTMKNFRKMRSWFDLKGLEPHSDIDVPGIIDASHVLHSQMREEIDESIY